MHPPDCEYDIRHLRHLSGETSALLAVLGHAITGQRRETKKRQAAAKLLKDWLEYVIGRMSDEGTTELTYNLQGCGPIRLTLSQGFLNLRLGHEWPDVMQPLWSLYEQVRLCPLSSFITTTKDCVALSQFLPFTMYARNLPEDLRESLPLAGFNMLGQLVPLVEGHIMAMGRRQHLEITNHNAVKIDNESNDVSNGARKKARKMKSGVSRDVVAL